MNYTENYHLPQWAEDDRILMTDFNEAMENIEGGITAAAEDKFVVGSYTGNGKSMTDGGTFVALPFRPRFVIVSVAWLGVTSPPDCMLIAGEHMKPQVENLIQFKDNGFRVAYYDRSNMRLNVEGTSYSYIAFQ